MVGVLTAVLTAFYMSRWFFLIFLGPPRWQEGEHVVDPHAGGEDTHVPAEHAEGPEPSAQDAHVSTLHPHESPPSMTVPLVVLGLLSLVGGVALNPVHHGPFFRWLEPVVAPTGGLAFAEHGALTEPVLIGISVVAGLLGIGVAWLLYGPQRDLAGGRLAEPVRGPVAELLERRFFVDEAYEAVFVRFGGWVARLVEAFDRRVVDGLVDGAGVVSTGTGRLTRRAQTGLIRGYLGGLVLGAVVLAAVILVQVR